MDRNLEIKFCTYNEQIYFLLVGAFGLLLPCLVANKHSSAMISSTEPELQVLTRQPSCHTPPGACTQINEDFIIWLMLC